MTTVGVFHTRLEAERAIEDLKRVGVSDARVSYDRATESATTTDAVSGLARGAGIGLVIGIIASLIVVAGAWTGLSTLFIASPISTALGITGAAATILAAALTGLIAGGIVGLIVGVFTPSTMADDTRTVNSRTGEHTGDIVVTAETNRTEAKEIMKRDGAEEVREF